MERNGGREAQRIAQLLILGSYTAMTLGLVAETFLMSWELWAVPLVLSGVALSWLIHFRQRMNSHQRIWVYTFLMMATFFFYGTHVTSTYDMALLMMTVMIIYTVAGDSKLVVACQATYYFTLACDLVAMARAGTRWDSLLVSRTLLHILLVFLAGWLARFIIRQWDRMFRDSDARIAALDDTARRMNGFMANLSHELRTPVNAILGIAEVAAERDGLAPETRKALSTIRDAGARMASQVSDIMDYSEIETESLAVNSAPYALSSLINDLVAELTPRIPEAVELVIDVDADTPSELVSDAGKLRKTLFHIIGNSLKFTREGGVYVHVQAVKQAYGVNLCVEVTDTGIGMDEAEAEQVANRYYQAESGKAMHAGGLGLGLPIAHGFVRALGGFMMIESRKDRGTTVRLSIPQAVADGQRCMSVANRDSVNLGGFLNIGKFSNPYVRDYYNAMILNVVKGLGTPMHRVSSVEDLKKLAGKLRLTHLFMGLEEYRSAPEYVEALARETTVVVVARDGAALPEGSAVYWMPKPLYGFPIAEMLNAGYRSGGDAPRLLACPDARALVVDDEPMNLSVASEILRRYGMHVATAASGREAIRACRETAFDIVFMDHMMPEMDGVEAMRQIRRLSAEERRSCPIVALTANALSSAREMFIAEGFDGFVSKPIEIPELERVLRRVLPREKIAYVRDRENAGGSEEQSGAGAEADRLAALAAGGLNTADALRYCQGDAPFYESLLRQFEAEQPERRRQLEKKAAEGDAGGFAILVHALKSSARLIGADALSERARRLEEAAKAGDGGYVAAHCAALLEAHAAVADLIRGCLGGGDAPEAAEVLEFAPEGEGPIEFMPEGGR